MRLRVEGVDAAAPLRVVVGGRSARTRASTSRRAAPDPVADRKDLDDLEFALELGVDYVALSFVRAAADVQALRTLIEAAGSPARVIAKIEKAEAVAVLDDDPREADAVMVARGDLGVEIGAAEVPLLQKRIILRGARAREAGDHRHADARVDDPRPEPTRAEASDVANAILDGTSALMLSGETAIGDFRSRRSR